MICSRERLWAEIEEIVPHAKKSGLALPAALEAAAIKLFILEEIANDSFHAKMVRQGLIELNEKGFLEFTE